LFCLSGSYQVVIPASASNASLACGYEDFAFQAVCRKK